MMVRPATDEDIAAIHRIAVANPTAPQWSVAQFRDALQPGPGLAVSRSLLIAIAGETVAGFAVVSALEKVYPVEAELESIAVLPDLHGRGIGQRLLQAVFSWCQERSVTAVRLEVRAGNRHAINLYARAGFRPEGTRPGYYQRPTEDAICMICMPVEGKLLPHTQ